MPPARRRLIIDTDPGVDDAYAIALCAQSMREEVDIVGYTTVFGNCRRDDASRNAKLLVTVCARNGDARTPVVDVAKIPLRALDASDRSGKEASTADDSNVFIADFVHGVDGLGGARETYERAVRERWGDAVPPYAYDASVDAADFIAETCARYPGEVTVLALASLTNVALAFRRRPECLRDMDELVVLGGAIEVNGNVNPAAEANILCDPEAADEVFSSFERTYVVGLDVTTRVRLTAADISRLARPIVEDERTCTNDVRRLLHDCAQFYKDYHTDIAKVGFDGVYVHDPTALFLAVPSIRDAIGFRFATGAVRVVTDGIARGHTILDRRRAWHHPNDWSSAPAVSVAVDVDVDAALRQLRARLGIADERHTDTAP